MIKKLLLLSLFMAHHNTYPLERWQEKILITRIQALPKDTTQVYFKLQNWTKSVERELLKRGFHKLPRDHYYQDTYKEFRAYFKGSFIANKAISLDPGIKHGLRIVA